MKPESRYSQIIFSELNIGPKAPESARYTPTPSGQENSIFDARCLGILISPGFGLALGAPHVLWSRKGTAGKNQTKARSPCAAIATELAALSRCACGALLNFFVASVDGVHLRAGPVGIEW